MIRYLEFSVSLLYKSFEIVLLGLVGLVRCILEILYQNSVYSVFMYPMAIKLVKVKRMLL